MKLSDGPDVFVLYVPFLDTRAIGTSDRQGTPKPPTVLLGDMSSFQTLTPHVDLGHVGIAFEKSAMIRQLSTLLDAPVVNDISFTGKINLATAKGSQIAMLGTLVWSCLDTSLFDRSPSTLIEHLLNAMMIMLLETVPNNYSGRLAKLASPAIPKHLKRAIEYMHANVASPMNTADIAEAAGTSIRSLQAAFQQFKGTTPLNYLRTIRLEGARNALMDPTTSLSIAKIAQSWGFSHMGRFAALYRRSFGEMPSNATKQRRPVNE
ncbi:helix-turn-helix domain-containing protein (plasmid) [Rhizobium sp. CB3090]|uniref:AraC family transcriptional regulator n=1 Tax=Rhizobium sp. CB3090 TaxID=3039156 RepID=UPI0024B1811F|nr:helix-turn-helix domain-containing protein [Rhizobium sp. CB3090]WFU12208.1 helix-turn-helix domain-containing protein [Rhizobium sp. CB3090]